MSGQAQRSKPGSKTIGELLLGLLGGTRSHRPQAFGHHSNRSKPHSRLYTKAYADGRQKDVAYRQRNGLPVSDPDAEPRKPAYTPAPSAKARLRKELRGSPLTRAQVLRALTLAELRDRRKQKAERG